MWKTIYAGNLKTHSASNDAISVDPQRVKYHEGPAFPFSLSAFCCIVLLFLLSACTTAHYAYSRGMFQGKEALKKGDYVGAKREFEEAYQHDKTRDNLMFLAIVDYKMNNQESAERLIREAEIMGSGNYHFLRVLGYKALILLKKNRDMGLEALNQYVAFYALNDPLMSINDVQEMARSGNIAMPRLENLIEEQVSWFERDVELYIGSGVGYYDGRDVIGGPFRFQGGAIFR